MSDILMKCGHTAQGEMFDNGVSIPVCVICNCKERAVEQPSLAGRTARCSYYGSKCHSEVPSSFSLAFFKHQPEKPNDSYYCGCYGWG